MGKRGGKRGRNQITGKRIDGGATKECPSKLSPIKVEAAANNNSKSDVGGEPFEVKHRKKRSRSLTTDGVEYGGGKDSACGDDDEPVMKSSFDPEEVGAEEVEKNDNNRSAKYYKIGRTTRLPKKRSHRKNRIFSKFMKQISSYKSQGSSLVNEWFKIKTFDLKGGDGGTGGSNGADTNGGVGGQVGGAGGVAK